MLPDFLIIGAQKSGTSALRYNLSKHPDLYVVENELHFFNNEKNWSQGTNWYRSFFNQPDKIQGEKTPNYLSAIKTHDRLAKIVPDAKLLILLRNPVDRAYSAWNYFNLNIERSKNWGWEVLPFESLLSNIEKTAGKPMINVINNGHYIVQINNLLKYYPREQLYIGVAERFRQNPANQFMAVQNFLGLSQAPLSIKERNVMPYHSEMNSEAREILEALYAPFNDRLFEFLGEDIAEWKIKT